MADKAPRYWHPRLGIERVLRAILTERWSREQWKRTFRKGRFLSAAVEPLLMEATFDTLFEWSRPKATSERWTEIPWIGELWEARRKAAAELRPLFLWAMSGHPFGCV